MAHLDGLRLVIGGPGVAEQQLPPWMWAVSSPAALRDALLARA